MLNLEYKQIGGNMAVGSHGLTEKQRLAVELIATNISIKNTTISNQLKCSVNSVSAWRKNPNFIEAIYDRYVEVTGVKLIEVLEALFEKAIGGDVQASRLLLEHHQKLQRNVNITIDSPFEKFMKINNIQEGELVEAEANARLGEAVFEVVQDKKDTPEAVVEENPTPKQRVEHAKLDKKAKFNADQARRRKLRIRAEAIGMELFPLGKHPKHEREAWLKKLKKLEAEQGIIYPDDEF